MIRSTSIRLAVLVLGAGLIAVLPASAAAKPPKAKAKLTLVTTSFVVPPDGAPQDKVDSLASCPEGTTLLSGGAVANTPAPGPPPILDIDLFKSGPSDNSWFVRYDNDTDVALQPSVQAVCIRDRLKIKGAADAGKSTAIAAAKKPKAVSRVTQVNTPFTLPSDADPTTNGHAQIDVLCPDGTKIAGGGASYTSTDPGTLVELQESGPQGNGWHVRYDNDNAAAQTGIASALCLKSKLKVKGLEDAGKSTAIAAAKKPKARSKFEQVDQGVALPADPAGGGDQGRVRFTVACPEGTTIVGGGGKLSPAAPLADTDVKLEESGVQDNGWLVTFNNEEVVDQSATIHALCLKKKLKVK